VSLLATAAEHRKRVPSAAPDFKPSLERDQQSGQQPEFEKEKSGADLLTSAAIFEFRVGGFSVSLT
jgi:hypothetical protein